MSNAYENATGKKAKPILFIILDDKTKVHGEITDVFEYLNEPYKDKRESMP